MTKSLVVKAKCLRTNQTEAEQRLWYHLRGHRFQGVKFKRQLVLTSLILFVLSAD